MVKAFVLSVSEQYTDLKDVETATPYRQMVRRFEKKSRYLRGWRTMSWGRVGQHRKSGSSGGRGRSGRHKHKWTWVLVYQPDYFGKHGFVQPPSISKEIRAINVGELDQIVDKLVERGLAEYKDGKYYVNLLKIGYNKLLGGGKVTKPIVVETPLASRSADAKVREKGGEVIIVKGVLH